MSYSVLPAGEAFWRPSNQMGVLNTDLAKQLRRPGWARGSGGCGPARRRPSTAIVVTQELYVVIDGVGRIRVDDDLLELPRMSSIYVSPESVRQVFNDTDADVLWLVFGTPAGGGEHAGDVRGDARAAVSRRAEGAAAGAHRLMTDRLHFTGNDEADRLLVQDAFALLVGFALDQQVTVEKAFMGPLVLRERLGTLDVAAVAGADLDPIFRERPAIHRFPGAMATRVHELAVYVIEHYDGQAARVWTDATTTEELRANLAGAARLRGHEDQGARLGAGQALRRVARRAADPLAPDARGRRLSRRAEGLQGRQAGSQGRVADAKG